MMDDAQEIIDLYWELNRIYSSPHSESPEEMRFCVDLLKNAIYTKQIPAETLIKKMKEMTEELNRVDSMKAKLTNVIFSRFWEKTFKQPVAHREFRLD